MEKVRNLMLVSMVIGFSFFISPTFSWGQAPPQPAYINVPSVDCDGNYTVSWGASPGATYYTLQRCTSFVCTSPTTVYEGPETSYPESGVPPEGYYYQVRACNNLDECSFWEKTWDPIVIGPPLAPPTNFSVPSTNNCSTVYMVSWFPSVGATSYELERATDSSFSDPVPIYSGPDNAFVENGRPRGSYWYRVRACNSCGCTDLTSGGPTVVIYKPSDPAAISVPSTDCDGAYTVSWTPVSEATSYELQRNLSTIYIGPEPSFNEEGMPVGTYSYRVRASNSCGNSGWAPVSPPGSPCIVTSIPLAPSTISVPSTDCDGAYTVSWASVSGATSYLLERATKPDFSDPVPIYTGAGTSLNETGVPIGNYWYRVRASNSCGDSGWTSSSKCEVSSPPLAPSSLTVPLRDWDGAYLVSWAPVNLATSYELQRAAESDFSDAAPIYTGAGTSFDETGVLTGVHWYRVRASNSCDTSRWTVAGPCVIGNARSCYVKDSNAAYSYRYATNPINSWVNNKDNGSFNLSLGDFDFRFYGVPVTQVTISTNGYITFSEGDGLQFANVFIPNGVPPNAAIMPFWDDLDLTIYGSVRWQIIGTTPNRELVIEWYDVPSSEFGTENYSFEVILHESSDKIKYQYLDVESGTSHDSGASATVGIENFDGTAGLQFSYNAASLRNGLAIEFPPIYSIQNIFSDVLCHWAEDHIYALYNAGITGGCSANPLRFCPEQPVTRGQMAVFIEASLGHPPNACDGRFGDVPTNHPFCGFIERMADDGITGGCGGNNFCPNDPVTRGQMAVFIEVALANSPNSCTAQFCDVPPNHPFCGFIEKLAEDGVTGGCGGCNFCPDAPVTRAQMAVFLVAAPDPLTP